MGWNYRRSRVVIPTGETRPRAARTVLADLAALRGALEGPAGAEVAAAHDALEAALARGDVATASAAMARGLIALELAAEALCAGGAA